MINLTQFSIVDAQPAAGLASFSVVAMHSEAKSSYTASLYLPFGVLDLGPLDVSRATTDEQAREMATDRARQILVLSVFRRAFRLARDGIALEPFEVKS